ncbi:hypothetical protein NP493_383g00031 [Ridgeia piscesae]|uniref:Uncharacterized protein n=1 Tax=Ridgeia piscesae TaxID=27915 RepID=A0AAD9L2S4_RIDPI|nr:hypothetical protein NP493_383g00031 [Ridgeia piscesae]
MILLRSQNWQGWEQWSVTLDVFSLACSLRFAFNEGNGADVVMVSALDSFGQPSGATGRNAEKVTPVFTPYQLTQDTSGGAERVLYIASVGGTFLLRFLEFTFTWSTCSSQDDFLAERRVLIDANDSFSANLVYSGAAQRNLHNTRRKRLSRYELSRHRHCEDWLNVQRPVDGSRPSPVCALPISRSRHRLAHVTSRPGGRFLRYLSGGNSEQDFTQRPTGPETNQLLQRVAKTRIFHKVTSYVNGEQNNSNTVWKTPCAASYNVHKPQFGTRAGLDKWSVLIYT